MFSQTFLDLPMRTMSYTGTDARDTSLLAIIATDKAKTFQCHIFRCQIAVCRRQQRCRRTDGRFRPPM